MQLQNITNIQTITMSSREIAELTGKRHPDVKRDIVNMFEQLKEDVRTFAHTYTDSQNRQQTEFHLNKELTLTLVAGYNVKLRLAIIKRWNELEQQVNKNVLSMPNFLDPGEAAIAWGMEFKAKQEALLLLEQAKPKVEYVDNFVERGNNRSLTDVAKELNVSAKELGRWLRAEGHAWNNKTPLRWKQTFIDKGYGRQKLFSNENVNVSQALVTPEGDFFIKKNYKPKD